MTVWKPYPGPLCLRPATRISVPTISPFWLKNALRAACWRANDDPRLDRIKLKMRKLMRFRPHAARIDGGFLQPAVAPLFCQFPAAGHSVGPAHPCREPNAYECSCVFEVTVGTTKKCAATRSSMWFFRKMRQVWDGSFRCRPIYLATVACDT
jgi:hypothetical protein